MDGSRRSVTKQGTSLYAFSLTHLANITVKYLGDVSCNPSFFSTVSPSKLSPTVIANDSQESCVFLEGQNPIIVFSCFLLATVQNKSVLPLQFIPLRFLLQPSIFHVNNGTDTF